MRSVPYKLTREQLLNDLYQAYLDARRHKRKKPYQQLFEIGLEKNLNDLCDELHERRYHARPSTCFIITDPKKREVFAADFRDRLVHHLYFNYVHEMLERTFIQDSYSCIKGRGTHYGINRLEKHIRSASTNWQERCYVMKMDIRGYFMHINRERLLEMTLSTIHRMAGHKVSKRSAETWQECVDIGFVNYLSHEIIMLDPTERCQIHGNASDWDGLAHDKSLFNSPAGCGLPIGNLTSQLFSNVYLNALDQYVKRELSCKHYGRYVDDFYIVDPDRMRLRHLIPLIRRFLEEKLDLKLHEGKLKIVSVTQGIDFIGAYLKPWRRYVSNNTLRRMLPKMNKLDEITDVRYRESAIASYKGVLCHYRTMWLGGCLG